MWVPFRSEALCTVWLCHKFGQIYNDVCYIYVCYGLVRNLDYLAATIFHQFPTPNCHNNDKLGKLG